MSSNEEQIKKKIAEDKHNREIELFQEEEARLKKADLSNELPVQAEEDTESSGNIKLYVPTNDGVNKIRSDYVKLYPDRPIQKDVLTFDSQKEATDFFTTQATSEPPQKFLASYVDQNGKLTGQNLFSCGNKKLYEGTFQEIQEQLKADLKQKPDDLNLQQGLEQITRLINPAVEYRSALKQAKGANTAAEQSNDSDLLNPLETKPKSP